MTPPHPQTTFRVGISGHRPNRLTRADPPRLALQIDRILTTIRDAAHQAAAPTQPTLHLLSSLAEGSDRLVAEAALALGYTLQVPLPFPRETYEGDFETPASRQAFRTLLAQADAVFEPDAPPGERARGYRAAGETILAQCDLLLVLWDGEPAAGIGGTPELIDAAQASDRLTLRIDAVAPHTLTFLTGPIHAADPPQALAAEVRALLTLPAAAQPFAEEYRRENWPRRNASTAYTFTRLIGQGRLRFAAPRRPDDSTPEIAHPLLKPFFHWADALANYYGERSRSAALRLQLLALAAVVAGLLSLPFEGHRTVVRALSSIELASTVVLVAGGLRAARKPWHRRWLTFRALAEQLRSLDLLIPLGLSPPSTAATEADGSTLFGQYFFAAIVRQLGLPAARVDQAYLHRHRTTLAATLIDQAAFQSATAERYESLERTLHRLGLALFTGAAVLALYDVASAFDLTAFASPWTTTASALLPALGAGLASIAAQGEYERLAQRAHRMAATLHALLPALGPNQPLTLASLGAVAEDAAKILTAEVRDWQVLVSLKKPNLPV